MASLSPFLSSKFSFLVLPLIFKFKAIKMI
uniref:Uncharacterized protein n=1 Tax=Rhizophora mucronata TaxID=61149 RepID=A0A2P2PVA5_RHIMU